MPPDGRGHIEMIIEEEEVFNFNSKALFGKSKEEQIFNKEKVKGARKGLPKVMLGKGATRGI